MLLFRATAGDSAYFLRRADGVLPSVAETQGFLRTLTEVVFSGTGARIQAGEILDIPGTVSGSAGSHGKTVQGSEILHLYGGRVKGKGHSGDFGCWAKEDKETMPAFIRFLDRDIEGENYNGK